jgi:hypothetical protein
MAATADIPAPDGKSRTNTTTNFSTISSISSSYFIFWVLLSFKYRCCCF